MLRDSLHQPQYVEKLEKILRFVIKEKALTMQDLDNIWAAQVILKMTSKINSYCIHLLISSNRLKHRTAIYFRSIFCHILLS